MCVFNEKIPFTYQTHKFIIITSKQLYPKMYSIRTSYLISFSPKRKIHYIYKTTNLLDGKYYIGKHTQTSGKIDNYLGSGTLFYRILNKYGPDIFKKRIISYHSSSKDALAMEASIVTELVVNDPQCYNLKLGGEGGGVKGVTRTEETKRKISKAKKGYKYPAHKLMSFSRPGPKNGNYGKERSEETRRKISESNKGKNKGRKASPEVKEKISNGVKKYYSENSSPMKGKQFSDERNKKMGDTLRGRVYDVDDTRVSIIQIDGIISTIKEASVLLGIAQHNIRRRCESEKEEWKDWIYIRQGTAYNQDKPKKEVIKVERSKKFHAKKVSINGTIYKSINKASVELGIGVTPIINRCRSDKEEWKDWFYIS